MKRFFKAAWYSTLFTGATLFTVGMSSVRVNAQTLYNPLPLSSGQEVTDTLSEEDIPTGDGGFSRDYRVRLEDGDQVAIDLISDEFDPIVILLAADGSTVAENDDGPDGTTNSLLFARITEGGEYIVRVRAFGETGGGMFNLKVTRLRPVEE
ncbi:PPC domain-containing protein [Spirulina sp. CS-785/01]|uniref:PPC domain-containing protein n=1 Tax=Spirulina sp. CS-785/01 TaxID=3021716 RepID=UPI00232FCD4B|nr:PPC domain-containing protein [Spirulina sp. CS-785/01]MDB9314084.1 PPC domain-containing protein [Spirulina sp. CS-785/01]